jgi:hypothetical protein
MPKPRSGSSYRLSEEAQELVGRLSEWLGVSRTGILEMAIRKLAREEFGGAAPLQAQSSSASRVYGSHTAN